MLDVKKIVIDNFWKEYLSEIFQNNMDVSNILKIHVFSYKTTLFDTSNVSTRIADSILFKSSSITILYHNTFRVVK